jgi:hypothetical protein
VFLKVPAASSEDRYWVEGSKLADCAYLEERDDKDNRQFSLRVDVPNQAYGLYLHVIGQPQHVIAKTDFVALPVDQVVGDFDWREAIVTVSFEDDRHCEGVWPPDSLLFLRQVDHIRRQVLYAGDQYRQDWLVPGTVLRVNPLNGQLVRSSSGGWIANDTDKLVERAQQLFAYFGRTRRSLSFSTGRLTTAVRRGDLVTEVGDLPTSRQLIGSVVSQLTVTSPAGTNAVPRMEVQTTFLELDSVQL